MHIDNSAGLQPHDTVFNGFVHCYIGGLSTPTSLNQTPESRDVTPSGETNQSEGRGAIWSQGISRNFGSEISQKKDGEADPYCFCLTVDRWCEVGKGPR